MAVTRVTGHGPSRRVTPLHRTVRLLKRLGKRPVTSVLYHTGFYGWRLGGPTPGVSALILYYHRVSEGSEGGGRWDTGFEKGVEARRFAAHMQFLSERCRPVPLHEVAEAVRLGRGLPRNAVAVTFDDGYEDNYRVALPILRRFSIPATVFVVAALIGSTRLAWWDAIAELVKRTRASVLDLARLDPRRADLVEPGRRHHPLATRRQRELLIERLCTVGRSLSPEGLRRFMASLHVQCGIAEGCLQVTGRMMSWAELRALATAGVGIESHTHTHPNMATLDCRQAGEELAVSKEILEGGLGQRVTGFAYPFGVPHPDQRAIQATAHRLGYAWACIAGERAVGAASDPFLLPRLGVPDVPLPVLVRDMMVTLTARPAGRAAEARS